MRFSFFHFIILTTIPDLLFRWYRPDVDIGALIEGYSGLM